MKLEELVLAKCINNIDPRGNRDTGLEIGKYYIVEEIHIGQSSSYIKINEDVYNSILFEYYTDHLEPFDIYSSKYSPYYQLYIKEKQGDNYE